MNYCSECIYKKTRKKKVCVNYTFCRRWIHFLWCILYTFWKNKQWNSSLFIQVKNKTKFTQKNVPNAMRENVRRRKEDLNGGRDWVKNIKMDEKVVLVFGLSLALRCVKCKENSFFLFFFLWFTLLSFFFKSLLFNM